MNLDRKEPGCARQVFCVVGAWALRFGRAFQSSVARIEREETPAEIGAWGDTATAF